MQPKTTISPIAFCAVILCTALFLFFCHSLATSWELNIWGNTASFGAVALFCLCMIRAVPSLENYFGCKRTVIDFEDNLAVYGACGLWIAFNVVLILAMGARRGDGDFLSITGISNVSYGMYRLAHWIDQPHYINIATYGYRPHVYEVEMLIVFFPLYPILLRIGQIIFRDYIFTGMIINAFLTFGAAVVCHKLAGVLYGHNKTSLRALKYVLIFPAGFFLYIPMTEALFLFLSLTCFYFMVKDKFYLAAVVAFFAALTRLQGILLAVPLCIEAYRYIRERAYAEENEQNFLVTNYYRRLLKGLLDIPLAMIFAIGPMAGFAVYLGINWFYYGDPLQFLYYQQSHWSQELDWFFNTASAMAYSMTWRDRRFIISLSLPNLITMFYVLIVLAIGAKWLRISLLAYAMVYFAISYGAAWLLSGPRYALMLFPAAFALAVLTRKKWVDYVTTGIFLAAYGIYFGLWIGGYYIF